MNAAAILAAVAVLPELPVEWGRWVLLGAAVINIGLRIVTREPLTLEE
jgi:hypothetical protein